MSATPWFDKLDRADDFLSAVVGAVNRRARAAGGTDAWIHGPQHREARERAARLLVRASGRVDREAARLARTAPVPAAEGIVRARLHARSEDRTARERAARNPRPLGRAAR